MDITIDNILESIANPQGKFRTMDGIYAISDRAGVPYHTLSNPYVKFMAVWDGKSHIIMVPFRDWNATQCHAAGETGGVTGKMKNACALANKAMSRYLTHHSYLESELTVFDDEGTPHSLDIVLAENPPGRALLDYAREKALAGDRDALKKAFDAFCGAAKWLLGSGLTHGRIRNANLRIDGNYNIKLLDYRYLTADDVDSDNENIAAIALYLKALADDPQLIFRINHLPPSIVAAQLPGIKFMASIKGRRELVSALDALRNTDIKLTEDDIDTEATGLHPGYDHIDPPYEGIRRVERGGMFGFIDDGDHEITPAVYQFATAFSGGRSVVVADDHFGMIDSSGKYILEPVYESIDWYSVENIAQVSHDGKFGLNGRSGEAILEFTYDWMGEISEGLICVRSGSLYGYIDTAGNPVIKPVYTDAGSFRNGRAAVSTGGDSFYINKNGKKI